MSAKQEVARRRRQLHRQAVELLGDNDLAAEPRRKRQVEGEVEHVFLVLARCVQQLVPLRIDNDMTGGTGKRAFAGSFDVDAVTARYLEHRHAEGRLDLAWRAVTLDESNLWHLLGPRREIFGEHRCGQRRARIER